MAVNLGNRSNLFVFCSSLFVKIFTYFVFLTFVFFFFVNIEPSNSTLKKEVYIAVKQRYLPIILIEAKSLYGNNKASFEE